MLDFCISLCFLTEGREEKKYSAKNMQRHKIQSYPSCNTWDEHWSSVIPAAHCCSPWPDTVPYFIFFKMCFQKKEGSVGWMEQSTEISGSVTGTLQDSKEGARSHCASAHPSSMGPTRSWEVCLWFPALAAESWGRMAPCPQYQPERNSLRFIFLLKVQILSILAIIPWKLVWLRWPVCINTHFVDAII